MGLNDPWMTRIAIGFVVVDGLLSSIPAIGLCSIGGLAEGCLVSSDERPPPSQNKSGSGWFVSELVVSFLTLFTPSSGQVFVLVFFASCLAVVDPLSPAAVWFTFLFSGWFCFSSFFSIPHTGPSSAAPPPAAFSPSAPPSCFPLSPPSPFSFLPLFPLLSFSIVSASTFGYPSGLLLHTSINRCLTCPAVCFDVADVVTIVASHVPMRVCLTVPRAVSVFTTIIAFDRPPMFVFGVVSSLVVHGRFSFVAVALLVFTFSFPLFVP